MKSPRSTAVIFFEIPNIDSLVLTVNIQLFLCLNWFTSSEFGWSVFVIVSSTDNVLDRIITDGNSLGAGLENFMLSQQIL